MEFLTDPTLRCGLNRPRNRLRVIPTSFPACISTFRVQMRKSCSIRYNCMAMGDRMNTFVTTFVALAGLCCFQLISGKTRLALASVLRPFGVHLMKFTLPTPVEFKYSTISKAFDGKAISKQIAHTTFTVLQLILSFKYSDHPR